MTLVHNLGLELPIYTEETEVAWLPDDMVRMAQSGVEEFVRRMVLEYKGRNNKLKYVLRLGDAAISRTAEVLGAKPPKYSWGLYRGPSGAAALGPDYDSSLHPLIPAGHCLVAKVEAITPLVAPDPDTEAAALQRVKYYQHHGTGFVIRDVREDQLAYQRADDGSLVRRWPDVEPRLYKA